MAKIKNKNNFQRHIVQSVVEFLSNTLKGQGLESSPPPVKITSSYSQVKLKSLA